MKILILSNIAGGLYKFRKELIAELCKNNEVYAVIPGGEYTDDLEHLGCKIIEFEFDRRGTNPLADFKQIRRYRRLLRREKPDVVLTYTIKPNVYGGIACQKENIPYIANVTGLGTAIENGGMLRFVTTTLYKIGLNGAQCVFFQNDTNKSYFIDNGIVRGNSRLIPGSGVSLVSHPFCDYPEESDTTRFLFVGRLMKDKGIEELIQAFNEVHKDKGNILLDIVGFYDESYEQLIHDAEETRFINYHGQKRDVTPFYNNCHCVVLPSYHEGMSNVLLEAAATGRPVIATNVPGCMETFDDGITGFGCEPQNSSSLVSALNRFLDCSYESRRQMGIEAHKKIAREFDRAIVIDAYLEEISKIQ